MRRQRPTSTHAGTQGDLDCDGQTNGADLSTLLGSWGSSGPGDLDVNGTVGGADLAILLSAWTG